MSGFFRGWRRKVGVVTLVISCLFMTGWVRSLTTNDAISFHSGRHTTEILQSVKCVLVWQRSKFDDAEYMMTIPVWTTHKFYPDTKWFDETGTVWRWQLCGFGFGELPSDLIEGVQVTFFFVPYWFITIPLTAFSAYLLLSKPQKSIQLEIDELVPSDGKWEGISQ